MDCRNMMPKPRSKTIKRLYVLASLVVGTILFCILGYWFLEMPRYVILKIPLTGTGWYVTEYSTKIWRSDSNRYFQWRKGINIYGTIPGYSFDSLDQVFKYFDDNLAERKWSRYEGLEVCSRVPESNFLEDNKNIFEYRKKNDVEGIGPRVCLAIWEEEPYQMHSVFNVVLQTENPSFLTSIRNGW